MNIAAAIIVIVAFSVVIRGRARNRRTQLIRRFNESGGNIYIASRIK